MLLFFVLVTRNDVTVCVSCLFGVCASAVGSEHIAFRFRHTKIASESNCLFWGESGEHLLSDFCQHTNTYATFISSL